MKLVKDIRLLILLLWIPLNAIACDCNIPKITDKYMQSEIVAKVKIVNIYKNEDKSDVYRADIVIEDSFKGNLDLKSIFIIGKNDGRIGNSCDIFIPKGTELIIYAKQNEYGQYVIGMCSGLVFLSKKVNSKEKKKICREIDILHILKERKINLTNKINFKNDGKINETLMNYEGVFSKKKFALYSIVFDKELNIVAVTEIETFDLSIDSQILEILKKSKWSSFVDGIKNRIPNNTIFILGIYYYPNEGSNNSFFSLEYL